MVLSLMLSAFARIPVSDLILVIFIVATALWVLLAEFLPGRRGDDPPDAGDEEPGPAALPLAA